MKILVIGGTRYFGIHMVNKLLEQGHDVREIITYVENKTGKKAIISEDGEPAPYNSEQEYSINTAKAELLGY